MNQAATLHCFLIPSNDSFEGDPEEKRRKTTSVVIEQPAAENKVLIDNIPDNSSLFEEVCKQKCSVQKATRCTCMSHTVTLNKHTYRCAQVLYDTWIHAGIPSVMTLCMLCQNIMVKVPVKCPCFGLPPSHITCKCNCTWSFCLGMKDSGVAPGEFLWRALQWPV